MKNFIKQNECGICSSENLKKIIDLKKFPLTGIFIKKKISKNFPYHFNQGLNICKNCGHLQLENFVSPKILYNNIYANRTSESFLSDNAINFFKKFLFRYLKNTKKLNILEIGCNDTKFLKNVGSKFNHSYGIDPIWIKKKTNLNRKKFTIIGNFIEKINLQSINRNLDAVISTHNLEHIQNPFNTLKRFVDNLKDKTIFFIEVPDADLMIKNLRFDQIFHQHYHYLNLHSLNNLTNRLGCKVIGKEINYKFWGGSLMIAFQKDTKTKQIIKSNYKIMIKKITNNYKLFKKKYKKLNYKLKKEKNLIGYGAGQMVPSVAYHLDKNLNYVDFFVDDNPNRANQKYPFIKAKIKLFEEKLIEDKNNRNVLITALDGAVSIGKKLKKLKVKYYNPSA